MLSKREIKKKMLIKQTINAMNRQIQKLEEQKQLYIDAGKQARERGLEAQYNLALSGLKMTIAQQRRVYEMKLNFEITSQMKDMTAMTSEFLKGMGSLSKDMMRLSKDKEFLKVGKSFAEAMAAVETQSELLEDFMDTTQSAFESGSTMSSTDSAELEGLMGIESSDKTAESDTASEIEKELEALKKQMG